MDIQIKDKELLEKISKHKEKINLKRVEYKTALKIYDSIIIMMFLIALFAIMLSFITQEIIYLIAFAVISLIIYLFFMMKNIVNTKRIDLDREFGDDLSLYKIVYIDSVLERIDNDLKKIEKKGE